MLPDIGMPAGIRQAASEEEAVAGLE